MDKGMVEIKQGTCNLYVWFNDMTSVPGIIHGALKEKNLPDILKSLVNNGGELLQAPAGDAWRKWRVNLDNEMVAVLDNDKCLLYLPLKSFQEAKQVFCI